MPDPAAPAGADGEKAKKAEKDAKRKASGDRMGARVEARPPPPRATPRRLLRTPLHPQSPATRQAGMGDKALKGRKLKKALKPYAKAISAPARPPLQPRQCQASRAGTVAGGQRARGRMLARRDACTAPAAAQVWTPATWGCT